MRTNFHIKPLVLILYFSTTLIAQGSSMWQKLVGPWKGRIQALTVTDTEIFLTTDSLDFMLSNDLGGHWISRKSPFAGIFSIQKVDSVFVVAAVNNNFPSWSGDSGKTWNKSTLGI